MAPMICRTDSLIGWSSFVRDDHTRNHAFLMDEHGAWTVSPAYDLTFSPGAGGEHALTIAGEGTRLTEEHMRRAAISAGVRPGVVMECLDKTRSAVARWPEFASAAGVSRQGTATIGRILEGVAR